MSALFLLSFCMLGLWSSLEAGILPCLTKGAFLPSPCQTHPAQVPVVALVTTVLVSIQGMQKGGPLDSTCLLLNRIKQN